MRDSALRFGECTVSDPHAERIAKRDKEEASQRFQATVEFHLTMRRYGRIMLVLLALTLALSMWGIFRDVRQEARMADQNAEMRQLSTRVEALEATRGKQ